jgi:hypothetical protein
MLEQYFYLQYIESSHLGIELPGCLSIQKTKKKAFKGDRGFLAEPQGLSFSSSYPNTAFYICQSLSLYLSSVSILF